MKGKFLSEFSGEGSGNYTLLSPFALMVGRAIKFHCFTIFLHLARCGPTWSLCPTLKKRKTIFFIKKRTKLRIIKPQKNDFFYFFSPLLDHFFLLLHSNCRKKKKTVWEKIDWYVRCDVRETWCLLLPWRFRYTREKKQKFLSRKGGKRRPRARAREKLVWPSRINISIFVLRSKLGLVRYTCSRIVLVNDPRVNGQNKQQTRLGDWVCRGEIFSFSFFACTAFRFI